MALFNKLHERKTPPGLEWALLKLLPKMALFGSLAPICAALVVRMQPLANAYDNAKRVKSVDIAAIASEITLLTALFTIGIGCVIVHIMKGPAYVSDSYPLSHSDQPQPRSKPPHDDR